MSKLKIFKRLILISGGIGGLSLGGVEAYDLQDDKKGFQKIPASICGFIYGFPMGAIYCSGLCLISPVLIPALIYDELRLYKLHNQKLREEYELNELKKIYEEIKNSEEEYELNELKKIYEEIKNSEKEK